MGHPNFVYLYIKFVRTMVYPPIPTYTVSSDYKIR